MKKQTIAILCIIAVGSLFSVVYAAGTIITDTSITTNAITTGTMTVTSSCSGCGAGEGTFSTWTLLTNTTFTPLTIQDLEYSKINTNGTSLIVTQIGETYIIDKSGTIIKDSAGSASKTGKYISGADQSVTGLYQTMLEIGSTKFAVFSKSHLLQETSISTANTFFNINDIVISMSPDGKYILLTGADKAAPTTFRYVIYQGS